jgi:hypothetical protein
MRELSTLHSAMAVPHAAKMLRKASLNQPVYLVWEQDANK